MENKPSYIRALILICLFTPVLSGCGSVGGAMGRVARLPVDLVKAGTGMYQDETHLTTNDELFRSENQFH